MEKILFIGTYPPKVNGQSLMFKFLYDNYDQPKELVNLSIVSSTKISKIIFTSSLFFKYLRLRFFTPDFGIIYLSGAVSVAGMLKDAVLLSLFYHTKVPIINHLHGSYLAHSLQNAPSLLGSWYRLVYKRIDVYVALLPKMAEGIKPILATHQRVCVVPNSYDDSLNTLPLTRKMITKPVRLLYLSNLMYSKGLTFLLDAVDILAADGLNFELVIAGAYMDEYQTEKAFSANDMQIFVEGYLRKYSNLSYIGLVTGQEKLDLLANSDVFVLPTFYPGESQPLSIIEAMRAGNAIITTEHNYLIDMITDENGRLVAIKNAASLANAINELAGDPTYLHHIQNHNIAQAINLYDSPIHLAAMNRIFETLNS